MIKLVSVTIACDIGLSPKQKVNRYKLNSLYGQCDKPTRTATRKRRGIDDNFSDQKISDIKISKTINISTKPTNDML